MHRRLTMSLLAMLLVVTVACGGGGGGGAPAPVPPTKALVKLSTAVSTTSINGIESTLDLPFGVTVRTVPSATAVGTNAVVATNVTNTLTFAVGTYSAATATIPGSVNISYINGFGHSTGNFATVTVDIATGLTTTAGSFVIRSVVASDVGYGAIPGVVVNTSSALQSAGTWTQAVVTLSSAGTSTPIGTINVIMDLPRGATVSSTLNPREIASGFIAASGHAAGSWIYGTYTAATATIPARVAVQLMNSVGFGAGEFVTVTCDLPPNANPTAADFTTYPAEVGTIISSSTVTFPLAVTPSVTLQ